MRCVESEAHAIYDSSGNLEPFCTMHESTEKLRGLGPPTLDACRMQHRAGSLVERR